MDNMLLFSPWVCCKSAEIDAEVMFPSPHRQTPIINGKCDAIRICVYGLLDIWLSTTTSPLILLAQIPQQPQQTLLIALVHWEYQCTSQAGLRTKKINRFITSSFALQPLAASRTSFCYFSTWYTSPPLRRDSRMAFYPSLCSTDFTGNII